MDHKDIAVYLVDALLEVAPEVNTDPEKVAELAAKIVEKVKDQIAEYEVRESALDLCVTIIEREEVEFKSIDNDFLPNQLANVYIALVK